MKIGVPSGIGDISWVVSKLINAPEWPTLEIEIADGWPFRAQPYLEMVGVKNSYGGFKFEDIISFEKLHPYVTWEDITKKGFGEYLMQPNWHLEAGKPLSSYLPDLKTSYHYPITIPPLPPKFDRVKEGLWIGISCASYRGAHAWKTWETDSWNFFCNLLISKGYNLCFLGGRWDDLTDAVACSFPDDRSVNWVGRTDFPQVCSIHQHLSYYIGFSSGLGIIRTVMELPTLMLWPEHQQPLRYSWADPEDLDSGRYVACSYLDPKWVLGIFEKQERRFPPLSITGEEGGKKNG